MFGTTPTTTAAQASDALLATSGITLGIILSLVIAVGFAAAAVALAAAALAPVRAARRPVAASASASPSGAHPGSLGFTSARTRRPGASAHPAASRVATPPLIDVDSIVAVMERVLAPDVAAAADHRLLAAR